MKRGIFKGVCFACFPKNQKIPIIVNKMVEKISKEYSIKEWEKPIIRINNEITIMTIDSRSKYLPFDEN